MRPLVLALALASAPPASALLASGCSGRPAGPATTSTTGEASTGEDSEPRWTTGVMLPTTEASTGAALAEPCDLDADCAEGQACAGAGALAGCEGRCCAPLCSLSQPRCPAGAPRCEPIEAEAPGPLGVCVAR